MKKLLVFIFIILLACCAAAEETALPTFLWQRDLTHHWQVNPDGSIQQKGQHSLNDWSVCTICGSELWIFDDISGDISDYDEYGNLIRLTSIGSDRVVTEILHACQYNEDGVVLLDREYYNGVFYCESIYTVGASGEQLPVSQTAWNDDGTTSVNLYDAFGNCISSAVYDKDGSWIFETISEYTLTGDGWYIETKTTSRHASGETFLTENNLHGDPIRKHSTEADGTVWQDTVYEYEYEGITMRLRRQYSFGELVTESTFNAEGQLTHEVEYLEDGGRIVYEYNEYGDTIRTVTYSADGSVTAEETFEYDYSEYESDDFGGWFE